MLSFNEQSICQEHRDPGKVRADTSTHWFYLFFPGRPDERSDGWGGPAVAAARPAPNYDTASTAKVTLCVTSNRLGD